MTPDENIIPDVQTPPVVEKPKKKHKLLGCIVVFVFIIVIVPTMFGLINFMGPSFLIDLLHRGKSTLSDEEIDELINPVAPKNYQYPNPSTEAANRTVNCKDIYAMREFPRTNPLCLNVFKTTPEEIINMVSAGSYDRIVLYGQYSVFDSPPASDVTDNYLEDLYHNVKFMDQIAIPKLLSAYGLADVSYNRITKPYPYLYYRVSSLDESDLVCHYGDTSEKIQGCASGFFSSIIPITAIGPQLSSARPIVRSTDKERFSYLTHYPSDCYANSTFLHETSHLLNDASQGITGQYVMDSWLNEQIAGFFSFYGSDLVCGDGTVTMQKNPEVKDATKALAEFNSTYPPADLSHEYPFDSTCRMALLTEWYKYLVNGNYRDNFKNFFVQQRATTPAFSSDKILADFLLNLDPDTSARSFLVSKGCSL